MNFLTGALSYPLLEILWRGRTHPSMALAGGMGAKALSAISILKMPRAARALAGAAAITGLEYGVGMLFNKRFQVWDYRRRRYQYKGQICAEYAALWLLLSYTFMTLHDRRAA